MSNKSKPKKKKRERLLALRKHAKQFLGKRTILHQKSRSRKWPTMVIDGTRASSGQGNNVITEPSSIHSSEKPVEPVATFKIAIPKDSGTQPVLGWRIVDQDFLQKLKQHVGQNNYNADEQYSDVNPVQTNGQLQSHIQHTEENSNTGFDKLDPGEVEIKQEILDPADPTFEGQQENPLRLPDEDPEECQKRNILRKKRSVIRYRQVKEFEKFGRYVASELKALPLERAVMCRNFIKKYLGAERAEALKETT